MVDFQRRLGSAFPVIEHISIGASPGTTGSSYQILPKRRILFVVDIAVFMEERNGLAVFRMGYLSQFAPFLQYPEIRRNLT